MNFKNFLFKISGLVLLFTGYVHADKVVVWNLTPQAGVTEKEAIVVSSILTSEVSRISGNQVIGETEIRSLIKGEESKTSCGAEDTKCIAEIGNALGAPLSVSGIISKMGDYWVVTLQLFDVKKVEVGSRVTKKFKGKANKLIKSIAPMVCELFNDSSCMDKETLERKRSVTYKKKREKIVIWNLEPQIGVTEQEAITVSSVITGEISSVSGNYVIGESEIQNIISGEEVKMSCGVEDTACIAEIGDALGAPFSISGTISKMEDFWIITIQLFDVKLTQVKSRVTKKISGDANVFLESLTPLICELFSDQTCMSESAAAGTGDVKNTITVKLDKGFAKRTSGWVMTVLGLGTLGFGLGSHFKMKELKKDYDKTGLDDSYLKWRIAGIAGYAAGGAFLITGLTLIILGYNDKHKEKESGTSFYVVPYDDGFFAGLYGEW
jgi:TolB-like protein